MRTPSALSTSLMLSLFIILAGILLIIFIQFDRGYKLTSEIPVFHQEQNNLINNLYQNNKDQLSQQQPSSPEPEVLTADGAYLQPLNPDQSSYSGRVDTRYSDRRNLSGYYQYDESYLLRQNPWSPDYRPGY